MTATCPSCGAALRLVLVALDGGDTMTHSPAPSTFDRLMARAAELGILVILGAVSERDAAELIGKSASRLRSWRAEGGPLAWKRRGNRVFYDVQTLADWLEINPA